MDKKWKQALRVGYEPPLPKEKEEFLRKLNMPKMTGLESIRCQAGYIRKRVWFLSAFITLLVIGLLLLDRNPKFANISEGYVSLWIAAALIPFLVLLTIVELSRSGLCGMEELELSCRYSLSQIMIARLILLGFNNVIVLFMLVLLLGTRGGGHLASSGLYIFAPYFMTCAFSMMVINRIRARESIYGCAIIACAVSLSSIILEASRKEIFTAKYHGAWAALTLFGMVLLAVQIRDLIRTTEELKWNSILTD